MTKLISLGDPPQASAAARGAALWQLGFRPFYLLASSFAALSILGWAAQMAGWLGHAYLKGPLWHAHEMLFGFALAVVVGFLLTAGRNWCNRPTAQGPALAALALLWLTARVLVLTPWGWAAAVANVAFPLAAALALAIPFWAARIRRNYFFVGLLVLMAMANLAFHLSQLGVLAAPAWLGIGLALDVLLFIIVVMAGRVIPMFTNHGVPGAGAARHAGVENAALGLVLALLLGNVLSLPAPLLATLAGVAALAHAVRWALWRPWRTLQVPLVWVLHVAYAWIVLHLALRAGAHLGAVPSAAAVHALSAGAIGMLTMGMMTRTARGHLAMPLRSDAVDVLCYSLVLAGALVRVATPLLPPGAWTSALMLSALSWSAGFALYALTYGPRLCRPRLDGKPG